jgi:hypothetical protein
MADDGRIDPTTMTAFTLFNGGLAGWRGVQQPQLASLLTPDGPDPALRPFTVLR